MKEPIEYSDFEKLELRIGLVTEVTEPEWSRKLLELTVDFGAEIGTRIILSGIRQWYSPEDLVNKKFVFIPNLAEKKMGEGVSQGMMLMVDTEGQPSLMSVDESLPVGTVVR